MSMLKPPRPPSRTATSLSIASAWPRRVRARRRPSMLQEDDRFWPAVSCNAPGGGSTIRARRGGCAERQGYMVESMQNGESHGQILSNQDDIRGNQARIISNQEK